MGFVETGRAPTNNSSTCNKSYAEAEMSNPAVRRTSIVNCTVQRHSILGPTTDSAKPRDRGWVRYYEVCSGPAVSCAIVTAGGTGRDFLFRNKKKVQIRKRRGEQSSIIIKTTNVHCINVAARHFQCLVVSARLKETPNPMTMVCLRRRQRSHVCFRKRK